MQASPEWYYQHVLGGLFGQALGDAFAMPAYLTPQDTWDYYDGWLDRFYPAPVDHPNHAGLVAGQITDDTQQAIALAEAILEDGEVTVNGTARALVNWYQQINGEHSSYVGINTRQACRAILKGADPYTTGTSGDTDGGAMRILPVGLINAGNIDLAVKDTVTACTPTHYTRVAISAAAAVASAVAQALVPGASLEEILSAGTRGAGMGAAYGRTWLGASVSRRIDLALAITQGNGGLFEKIMDLHDIVGSTLAASETIPSAFGVLALAEGDPVSAARFAAALSGDADTVGAIACAIAGTWKGIEVFPEEVINTLEEVNPGINFRPVASRLTELLLKRLGA
ncbi:MAG: ADP-ribosylglycohydrolase family protein [Anaerolineales bacterium]|nr:ADP-ribosylglycohydrolase family protein [Anaerolineales bacterium]